MIYNNELQQLLSNMDPATRAANMRALGMAPDATPRTRRNSAAGGVSEAQIQSAIAELLLYDGWLVIRLNGGAMSLDDRYVRFVYWQARGYGEMSSGAPDLIAAKDNRVLFIECKAGKGRQRASQADFERAANSCGNDYILAYGVGDVEAVL